MKVKLTIGHGRISLVATDETGLKIRTSATRNGPRISGPGWTEVSRFETVADGLCAFLDGKGKYSEKFKRLELVATQAQSFEQIITELKGAAA